MPLIIARIVSIRFAPKLSCNTANTGIPPPTLASYDNPTLFARAIRNNSSPCFAITSLFAVTTCLPDDIAPTM